MNQPSPPPQSGQNLHSSNKVLETDQIDAIASRRLNLAQIQGRVETIHVFDSVQVDQTPLRTAKSISQPEYRWRQVLLDKVKQFWIDGVLAKSLHTQILIELGLENHSHFVQPPLSAAEDLSATTEQVFHKGIMAADIFQGMGAGRTLLILGEPGSGKTITLLKLTESLIARTEKDLRQPLPVVMNLSSWARQRQSIADWLVRELYQIYGVSTSLAETWIDQKQLILLLDGLDEVAPYYRDDCVKALNQFLREHGSIEMVVCSRIRDYENQSERLKLRSAIYVQPLTAQQIDQYLAPAGESLAGLRIALQHDPALQAFASSPLILSIMSLTYQGGFAGALIPIGAPEEQRQQLFNTYIDRMFIRRGITWQYARGETLRWLTWLAQAMASASQTVFWVEQLQPSWLSSQHQSILYRIASALMFAMVFGLVFGLAFGLMGGWMEGLLFGLIYGPIFGLIGEFWVGFSGNIKTAEILKWSWRAAIEKFQIGLMGSLIGVLIFGLIFGLIKGLMAGLIIGVIFGLIKGLMGGFSALEIQPSHRPNQGIWQLAKNALVVGLIFGLIGVLFFGLIGMPFLGLIFALMGALMGGGSACLRHFTLRLMLYRQGNAPLEYAHFLDYVANRLFIQKVGGGYIFVHRLLLEHFAGMYKPVGHR